MDIVHIVTIYFLPGIDLIWLYAKKSSTSTRVKQFRSSQVEI
jgi:hypothetical protein